VRLDRGSGADRVPRRGANAALPDPKKEVDEKRSAQYHRQLWRALLLVIKAKFEIVESGIETFDEAFLSNIVMSDGATVGEWATLQIATMYQQGEMPPLLPGPTKLLSGPVS
jgi:hypothetical protein